MDNAAELWHTAGGQLKIAVGYTLWDGMWHRPAWAVAPLQKPPVIETTRKREHYYGAILTNDEAAEFYKEEWIPPYQAEP